MLDSKETSDLLMYYQDRSLEKRMLSLRHFENSGVSLIYRSRVLPILPEFPGRKRFTPYTGRVILIAVYEGMTHHAVCIISEL